MGRIQKHFLAIVSVLLLFVLIRIIFLIVGGQAIDADEAIVGLMARHILNGEHTAFYYGQHYGHCGLPVKVNLIYWS